MHKMARGGMLRHMAPNQIANPEDVKTFDLLDFHYAPEHSNSECFLFLR